jgi:hypothetical protein
MERSADGCVCVSVWAEEAPEGGDDRRAGGLG